MPACAQYDSRERTYDEAANVRRCRRRAASSGEQLPDSEAGVDDNESKEPRTKNAGDSQEPEQAPRGADQRRRRAGVACKVGQRAGEPCSEVEASENQAPEGALDDGSEDGQEDQIGAEVRHGAGWVMQKEARNGCLDTRVGRDEGPCSDSGRAGLELEGENPAKGQNQRHGNDRGAAHVRYYARYSFVIPCQLENNDS